MELLRPRHLAVTALIILLTGTAAGGLVGAVATEGAPFSVPAVHAGDVGEYRLTHNERDGERAPGDVIRFAWQEDVRAPDGEGRLLWLNQLRIEHFVGENYWNNQTLMLEAGTTQRVAQKYAWQDQGVQPDNGIMPGGEVARDHNVEMLVYVDYPAWVTCGIIHSLQGKSFATAGVLSTTPVECTNGPHDGEPRNYEVRAAGLGSDDGARLLKVDVYDNDWGGRLSSMWLREDIPYPVRVETTAGAGAVIELVGFARGAAPIATEARPTDLGLAVAHGPWGTGPDLGGFAHPYPAAEAAMEAVDHPDADDLRAFLDAHPLAYIAEARHTQQYSESRELQSWSFTWADGHGAHRAAIVQDANWQSLAGQEIPGTRMESLRFVDYGPSDDPFPFPHAVPAAGPTVQSAVDWFQAYAGILRPVTEPVGYGWTLRCHWDAMAAEYDCDQSHAEVGAGVTVHRTYQQDPLYTQYAIQSNVTQVWLHDLRATHFVTGDYASERRTAVPVAQEAAPSQVASVSAWNPPTVAQTAGIAGFSVLVGLAYWLAPLLKGLPLFTRVQSSKLLDNPLRRSVHDAIEANPGIHFQELVRLTGQANGTVDHHLQKLQHGALVKAIEGPGYTCYFLAGRLDHRVMEAAPALKAEGARKILGAVCQTPGAAPKDVALAVGLSPQTVHYHLHRLSEAGLLVEEREGRSIRLRATDLASKAAPLL